MVGHHNRQLFLFDMKGSQGQMLIFKRGKINGLKFEVNLIFKNKVRLDEALYELILFWPLMVSN